MATFALLAGMSGVKTAPRRTPAYNDASSYQRPGLRARNGHVGAKDQEYLESQGVHVGGFVGRIAFQVVEQQFERLQEEAPRGAGFEEEEDEVFVGQD